MAPRLPWLCILAAAWCLVPSPCCADQVAVNGRVLASDGKTPLEGAIIAVYGEKADVIAHGTTGSDGRYHIVVPRDALHLSPKKKGGGFLGSILGGVTRLASIAATVAPVAMGGGSAAAAIAGGAGRLAGGAAGGGPANGQTSFKRPTAAQIAMMKRMMPRGVGGVLDQVYDQSSETPADETPAEPEANSPGALVVRVTRDGSCEVGGIAQVYWIQQLAGPPSSRDGASSEAWIDPILLSRQGEAAPSRIVRGYFSLSHGHVEPAIVERGRTVSVSVDLPIPEEPKVDVAVIARDSKTGEIYELKPYGGTYRAEVTVDQRFARNDQTISILAYARVPGVEGRSKRAEDAIASRGLWKLDKAFVYNPQIVASRNRIDLQLTVVEPPKAR